MSITAINNSTIFPKSTLIQPRIMPSNAINEPGKSTTATKKSTASSIVLACCQTTTTMTQFVCAKSFAIKWNAVKRANVIVAYT
jgi:hypothetical protein